MYALLVVVGLAAVLCLAQALQHGSRRWLIANALLNLVGLYTHYFYLFILLSQYLYMALTLRRHRRTFWRWVLANGIAVLVYLPWVLAIVAGGFHRAQIAWIEPLSWRSAGEALWQLNATEGQPLSVPAVISTLLLIAGVVLAAVAGRRKRGSAVPGLTWTHLLLPLALVALISIRQPLFHSRFLQIVLPAYLLLAAAGLMQLRRPAAGPVLVALLALAWVPTLLGMYAMPSRLDRNWQVAIEYLSEQAEPGDAVAFRGGQGYHAYWYYYDGPALDRISLTPEDTISELESYATDLERVWLVMWDTAQQCEVPVGLAPRPGDGLEIIDRGCFPQAQIVAYTWRQ
jgi:uncharacterized membrane protein